MSIYGSWRILISMSDNEAINQSELVPMCRVRSLEKETYPAVCHRDFGHDGLHRAFKIGESEPGYWGYTDSNVRIPMTDNTGEGSRWEDSRDTINGETTTLQGMYSADIVRLAEIGYEAYRDATGIVPLVPWKKLPMSAAYRWVQVAQCIRKTVRDL